MERPWIKFYVGDYLRDTQALSTEEHGAYLLILFDLWTHDGSISLASAQKVSRSTVRKWRQTWGSLRSLFVVSEDGLTVSHKRITEELAKYDKHQQNSSLGAQITNKKRWGSGRSTDESPIIERVGEMSPIQKSEVRSQKSEQSLREREIVRSVKEVPEKTPEKTQISPKAGQGKSKDNTELTLEGLHLAWIERKNPGRDRESFSKFLEVWKSHPVDLEQFTSAVSTRLAQYDTDTSKDKYEYLGVLRNFLEKDSWKKYTPKAAPVSQVAPDYSDWKPLPEIEV